MVNERIEELKLKAIDFADATYKYDLSKGFQIQEWDAIRLNEFTKLIVRECIEVALNERVAEEEIDKSDDIEDRCYLRGNNGGIVDAVVAIKQHFGVES
jgi:hypothetical protein